MVPVARLSTLIYPHRALSWDHERRSIIVKCIVAYRVAHAANRANAGNAPYDLVMGAFHATYSVHCGHHSNPNYCLDLLGQPLISHRLFMI